LDEIAASVRHLAGMLDKHWAATTHTERLQGGDRPAGHSRGFYGVDRFVQPKGIGAKNVF
jgi:hypothetical protein